MDDLINRQAAIEYFKRIIDATNTDGRYNLGFIDGLEFCISHLSTMPYVQPEQKNGDFVEVVRCKDCKFWNGSCCNYLAVYALPNGFCNWGRRRNAKMEEEEND